MTTHKISSSDNTVLSQKSCNTATADPMSILDAIELKFLENSCNTLPKSPEPRILNRFQMVNTSPSGSIVTYLSTEEDITLVSAFGTAKEAQLCLLYSKDNQKPEILVATMADAIITAELSAPDQELKSLLSALAEKFVYVHDFQATYLPLVKRFGTWVLPRKHKSTKVTATLLSIALHGTSRDESFLSQNYLVRTYLRKSQVPEELLLPPYDPLDEAIKNAMILPYLSRFLSAEVHRINGNTDALDIENTFIAEAVRMAAAGVPVNFEYLRQEREELQAKFTELEMKLAEGQGNISAFEAKMAGLKRRELHRLQFLQKYSDSPEGRIHPTINAISCPIGRTSTENPNIQGILRIYQKTFYKAPEGRAIIKTDIPASQIRFAAAAINEKMLIKAFNDGKDPHLITAMSIFGKEAEDITDEERQIGKAANFQMFYGVGVAELKKQLEEATGKLLTDNWIRQLIKAFLNSYPDFNKYQLTMKKLAKKGGQHGFLVETLSGKKMRVFEYTKGLNYPISGTEAEIMKIAVNSFSYECREQGLDAQIINFVHDSIVVECAIEDKEKAARLLKETTQQVLKQAIKVFTTEVDIETVTETPFQQSVSDHNITE